MALPSFAEHIPGEIVVKFKPGIVKIQKVVAASVRALAVKHGIYQYKQIYKDALEVRPDWKHLEDDYVLLFPKEKDVNKVINDYKKDPNVVDASRNFVVRAFATTPNDTYYSQQWGLSKIEAPKAWDRTTGSSEILVAVLDTGINYNHEDFAGKVNRTYAKDLVNGDTDPMDDFGHGTAVSGVIGAVSNNSKGIAGMDWKAKILPIKILNNEGEGSTTNISAALAYVAGLKSTGVNIPVVNMSLGINNNGSNKYTEENPSSMKDRCQEAYNQGMILVAAAGNDGVDWNTYPAYYSTVIAVAATDTSDKRAVWSGALSSNYAGWVDVSAPGSSIYSTGHQESSVQENDDYFNGWSGTSLATPYVSGLAALIKAANPTMTNAQVINQIKLTTDSIDAQNPSYVGKLGTGRINAYRALFGSLPVITSPASGECIKGVKEIRGTAAGWNFSSYEVEALRNGSVEVKVYSSFTSVESGVLASWNTIGLNGEYALRLKVTNNDLSSSETSAAVIVDNIAPEAAITSPVDGATVKGAITITGKAKDQYFDRYVLEYGEGASPAVFQNAGTYYSSADGAALGTWETSGLSGAYTLRLTVYDRAGTSTSSSIGVNVTESEPTKEAQAQAGLPVTFALPNPFDRTSVSGTTFVYDLRGNFDVVIYLFDLNGNLIWRKSYAAGENGGKAGENNPSWNAQNLYGESVPNGVYIYQVTADRKALARGKIIVLN